VPPYGDNRWIGGAPASSTPLLRSRVRPCRTVQSRCIRRQRHSGRTMPTTKPAPASTRVPIVIIRHDDVVSALSGPMPGLVRRPSCIPATQRMAPIEMITNAITALSPLRGHRRRKVMATVTATASPDLLHASSVRSRARPGSLSMFSWAVSSPSTVPANPVRTLGGQARRQ